jgi:hypothetical protein
MNHVSGFKSWTRNPFLLSFFPMNFFKGLFFTMLFFFAVSGDVLAQNWKFVLTDTPTVDREPIASASADVNGDGTMDLIAVGFRNSTLTVLTNNGSGKFSSNAVYHTSEFDDRGSYSVSAADLNGDGKPDLTVAEYYDGTLQVWTNNGSGVFSSNATYTVGGGVESVIAADMNADDLLDLVSTSADSSTVNVLTNKGDGTFQSQGTYNVGNGPINVATADVNGDGKPDLVTANLFGNSLTVLTNSGSGFVLAATLPAGQEPYWVEIADLNNDGSRDLISANSGSSTLSVFTNNGLGAFTLSTNLPVGASLHVTAADINGDGKKDLISAQGPFNQPGSLIIFTNTGFGDFDFAVSLEVGENPSCIEAMDANGDGRVDLVSANYDQGTLSVLFNLPLLSVQMTPTNNISVSWPSLSSGWTLQQSADLSSASWTNSTFTAFDDGTNKNILAPNSGNLFFRLSRP